MINTYVVLAILSIHWFADFVLQTDEQARGKSKDWNCLLEHTIIYSLVWLSMSAFYFAANDGNKSIFLFAPITFIIHTITDYYTSRANSQLWEEKKVHQFFTSIGFDQLLHFTQLILTFYYLTT